MAYATLRSFSYMNATTVWADPPNDTAPMLGFGPSHFWKMGIGSDMALPGAGAFPVDSGGNPIPFYLRGVSVSVLPNTSNNWVMIGHSGSNGDALSSLIFPGQCVPFIFPDDAAPLFEVGDYFDAHVSRIDANMQAYITFWWVPVS